MTIRWRNYSNQGLYDEIVAPGGRLRHAARQLGRRLSALPDDELDFRRETAVNAIRTMGITFRVYSKEEGSIDREWPFDIIPRVIDLTEWRRVEAGLKQRALALNQFIDDIYHRQQIVADGVFPEAVLRDSVNFRSQCVGIRPPQGVWAHICGSDLIRDRDGAIYVLEDNLRVPSGVSYMLENRQIMKRVFPELLDDESILPVHDYPSQLHSMLASISPRRVSKPQIVVLTPGIYNSAYFEHAYLAQQMGAELVEGSDLFVDEDDVVYMRTISGPSRVDVIYRRIDDLFLDPEVFNKDSMLGVAGLLRAWKRGTVALANAPGAGVADDKVVYAFVPDMIRYYLDEEPLLPNVPTYLCMHREQCDFVIKNLDKLVVKPANESGGYGMLIGPHATPRDRNRFAKLIKRDPRNYIAQPMLTLSTAPTLFGHGVEPRHLDLRPFILSGKTTEVTAGGLTRVAMVKGSMVVNSSQGGGSKDTWIVDTGAI